MSDVLIRDIPDDVLARLDVLAARVGLSRSEYIRRRLTQEARAAGTPVNVEHFRRFADTFGDLADPELMTRAWE
jgi:plasmid stability protein